jgi:peptidoglycan/xylan/chitin deacetylase (PgdA/CDA1 family)
MRTIGVAALLVCASAFLQQPAIGEEACGADKLGVARTVTINSVGGPRFGMQYKGRDKKPLLSDGEVVLTFDDGPTRIYTRPILEALAAQCAKATFFMVGRMALTDTEMVKEVARRGHTVGTHTWSHANIQSLPEDKARAEIELGFSAVQQALGRPVAPFFRFPYLRDSTFSLRHLDGRQIATFSIDIDSRDFEIRDAAALHQRVIADVKSRRKGIILFYDIHTSTARALPRILADLKSLGLRVVHLAPKTGAQTVAEYDTLARQELTRRRLAIARSPLAKRAVTWPMAGLQDAKVETKDTKEAKVVQDAAAPAASDAAAASSAPPAPSEDWASELWSRSQ